MEANPKKEKKFKGGDTCFWTTSMDEVLINAYLHQQKLGNRNGNCMTSSAMNNILQELRNHFPDRPISKEKIKDHMKNIKRKFNGCYDLFKNGLSGFAWDAKTSMWIAEPEVWDKLVKAKPEAAEWRIKPILFYDKLAQLLGKDRPNKKLVETRGEIRARRAAYGGNNYNDTIGEIDNLISTNELTLKGFEVDEEVHPDTSIKRPSISHSHDASSSRTKKRAKEVVEDDTNMGGIAKSFQKLVEVFEMSTIEFIKQNKNASVDDIWAQLEDIGIEPAFLPRVYMHLVQHPDALKAFNGVPVHKRKEMLPYIVPDYSPS